jgi:hypothetical protein
VCPWFFTLELVFFIFAELFHRQVVVLETEAAAGNTTINYEAALTAVETPVVVVAAAVDAAAAPDDAGNSGKWQRLRLRQWRRRR